MKHRQTGVGLVELMISLVLGLLVSALALQMFLGSRSSLSSQEALSYLQESARYVSYRLQPLMRNVGYAGCGNVENIEVAKGVSVEYDLTQPLSAKKKKYKEVDMKKADEYNELAIKLHGIDLRDRYHASLEAKELRAGPYGLGKMKKVKYG